MQVRHPIIRHAIIRHAIIRCTGNARPVSDFSAQTFPRALKSCCTLSKAPDLYTCLLYALIFHYICVMCASCEHQSNKISYAEMIDGKRDGPVLLLVHLLLLFSSLVYAWPGVCGIYTHHIIMHTQT